MRDRVRLASVIAGVVSLGLPLSPCAAAEEGEVVVRPGDVGGLYAPPEIDLSAVSPGRAVRPDRQHRGTPHSPAARPHGVPPPPLCPTLLCDAGDVDPAFVLPGAPLASWCVGPLADGRCHVPSASPGRPGNTSPVDPAVLAQQAARELQLPLPTPRHSPDLRLAGLSATVVGEHTWFWTDRRDWQPQHRRVDAGGAWAEVTATPVRLSMSPGNGQATVSCAGPGTPYERSFGVHAASPDCDVVYTRSSVGRPGDQVAAEWAITWRVTWRGGTGVAPVGGSLPAMTSRAQARLVVVEAQALRAH